MFYSFMGDKPLGFMCGSFHQFKREVSSFKWGVTTHLMRGRKWHLLLLAHPIKGCSPSPLIYIYIYMLYCSSMTCSSSCSLSLFPLLHRKSAQLRGSPAEIFSPPPPPSSCVVGVPGGSSTSAAPLERGIGGRRQAARVTEYGSAARLWRSSSRP